MIDKKLRHMNIGGVHLKNVHIKSLTEIVLLLCSNDYNDEEIYTSTRKIITEALRYGVYADRSIRKGVLLKTRNPSRKLERIKLIVLQDKSHSEIVADMKKELQVEINSLAVEESYLI